jgi:AcrR family transcriptional regulator
MDASTAPPRRRRPRGSLSREAILDAAEQVAHSGFQALTLRAVATQLDAAPMALYRHFSTKDVLINALLDRVLGRFTPEPATSDWVEDLRGFARHHRDMLVNHPWALAGFFDHPSPGPNATRVGEFALEILRRAGFDNDRVVATFSGLLAFNYGWQAFASARDVQPDNAAQQVREALAEVSASAFPHTAAVAAEMAAYGNDHHYELMLDQVLLGIRSSAPTRASRPGSGVRRTPPDALRSAGTPRP